MPFSLYIIDLNGYEALIHINTKRKTRMLMQTIYISQSCTKIYEGMYNLVSRPQLNSSLLVSCFKQ